MTEEKEINKENNVADTTPIPPSTPPPTPPKEEVVLKPEVIETKPEPTPKRTGQAPVKSATTGQAPVKTTIEPKIPEPKNTKAVETPEVVQTPPATPLVEPIKEKPDPIVIGMAEDNPIVPFMTQFLDKLKEFRGVANEKRAEIMKKNLDTVMEFAALTRKVTNDDVERITGVNDSQAQRYLKKLVEDGKLTRFGKTSGIYYRPTK